MVPLYAIYVRRDAYMITPVTVPEYELPLLQELFGVENVQNANGKPADRNGPGSAVGEFMPSDDEYARFCAKYGADLVVQVYGKQKTALAKLVKAAGKPKAKTDAATADIATADESGTGTE